MDKLKKIFCVFFGHSHIYDGCFGYMSCARCGEQLGDTIGGVFTDKLAVVVDHNCKECFENYEKLSWKDKLFIPFPFEKKDGVYRVITKEERNAEMDAAIKAMKKRREIRDQRNKEAEGIWERLPQEIVEWVPEDLIEKAFDSDIPMDDFFKQAYQKSLQ